MFCYPDGQTLRNGRLAHSGLADEDRVVFRPPVEDLQDPVDFPVPAYDTIDFVIPCQVGQIGSVHIEEFFLFEALFLLCLGAHTSLAVFSVGKFSWIRTFTAFIVPGERTAEEIQEWIALAVSVGVFGSSTVFHIDIHIHSFEKAAHLLVQVIDIVIGHARLLDQLVDGLYPLFLCAGEAKSFLYLFSVYYLCYKNYSVVFLAYRTHSHILSAPFVLSRLALHPGRPARKY